uniref:Deacetylase sirtuin-type domain-containing protein n=1 Tax=Oncorhynchus mykiss TaxID=8022 RepID=A0A8C7W0U3_ONCMY
MTYFMSSPLVYKGRLYLYHTITSSTARFIKLKHQQQRTLFLAPRQRDVHGLRPSQDKTVWWPGFRGLFCRGGVEDSKQQTLEDLTKNIGGGQYKRIIVMAGAGISTPSGIPDFRSPGSGLYDNLQQYNLPYAEAIFEINYFHHNPNPFFALAKELYPGNYQPNLTHYFIRLLHDKGQLLRMYTQNIDGLERLAGIPPEKLVEAHGSFATATCTVCLRDYKGEELRPDIMKGTVPKCPTCKGVVKPDIVFFGEELPPHYFSYLKDFPLADLLIIMGTSLEAGQGFTQSRVPIKDISGGALCQSGRSCEGLCPSPTYQQRPGGALRLGDPATQ